MWIKLRLKTQFFIIYFLDPRIKKKEWQKPKNFWDPGLLGYKKLGEIISYQDVRFAVVSLKSESKSASSRGEFHQALGNNALYKLRPVWTQTSFHNVPLVISLNTHRAPIRQRWVHAGLFYMLSIPSQPVLILIDCNVFVLAPVFL